MRYALVGCGKVAEKHLKAALDHRERLEVLALVDRDPAAFARLLDRCGAKGRVRAAVRTFSDVPEMLRAVRPEVVAITTPSGTHFAIAMDASAAGAHVIVEKPLTLDLGEAARLVDAARAAGVRLAVGHMYRFFPVVDSLRRDLVSGRFGRVLFGDVKVRWGHGQDYYDQAAWRGAWVSDGGALMNQSVHALDLMAWLMAEETAPVADALGSLSRMERRMEAEDYGAAVLRFRNGATCLVEGTTLTDPHRKEASFFVQCTRGSVRAGVLKGLPRLEVRDAAGRNLAGRYLRRWVAESLRTRAGRLALRRLSNPHSALYGDFLDAIRDGRDPRADGASGRDALALVLAVYRAAATGRRVPLPLDGGSTRDMLGFFDGSAPSGEGMR